MAKINGADLEFWFDGAEYPVEEVNLGVNFDEEESTDSATPGDGKDFEILRAARSFSTTQSLYHPDGAEINTGTLTKDQKYRVTAVDTVLAAYEVGQIFVSDGTEVMSSTDKVVPLGAKCNGKEIDFNYNSADHPTREANYNVNFDTVDTTDDATTGDASESNVTRASRESTITSWLKDTDADLLTTSPTSVDATLKFSTDNTIVGKVSLKAKTIPPAVNGYVPVTYSARWQGDPTETNMGFATGTEYAIKIILKRGATTNKQYTGNAIVTSKQVTAQVKGVTKITHQFQINGALTEAVLT